MFCLNFPLKNSGKEYNSLRSLRRCGELVCIIFVLLRYKFIDKPGIELTFLKG
jgi:hypothetical protein